MKRVVHQCVRAARVGALVAVGLIVWRVHDYAFGGNFDAIVAREAYRSGQLSGAQLREAIGTLGLRSVINLRGPHDEAWYREEIESCAAAGVEHFDLPFSGRELPSPRNILQLMQLLREAPRPLLVHCLGGADRTGLASSLYLIEREGMSTQEAMKRGLTPWNGHIPLGHGGELERFFELYSMHGRGKPLEDWVRDDYPAIYRREWVSAEARPPGAKAPE